MARLEKTHNIVITSTKGKTVRALVSVFGNVDYAGDRVMPGAFKNTIRDWTLSGDKVPFIWSHDWSDPMAHVGVVNSMRETDRGLEVEAEILDDTPFAKQVQRLLEQRRVTRFSFSYDIVRERIAEDGANELLEMKLIECGPCLSPMNAETQLLSRKSVQAMLAAEAHGVSAERTWAGTRIPQSAVDELLSKSAAVIEGFLDDLYESEVKMHPTVNDPEIRRLNAELDAIAPTRATPSTDADLLRKLDALDGGKTATGNITPATAALLMQLAERLAQSAVRATVGRLPDAEAALMAASRDLRTIASGGTGDVAAIVASVRPLIQELRDAGQTIAASNLERDLIELEGGVRLEVTNEDRVEGSVNVETPKQRAAREADAKLLIKLDELSPPPKSERKPRGRWTYDSPQRFIPDEEGVA